MTAPLPPVERHEAPAGNAPSEPLPGPHELTQFELVLPEQTNHYGTLFAPNGLALLGKTAFLAATRFTQQSLVMVASNRIEFLKPVPVGTVLRLVARVTRVGRTSLTTHVVGCIDRPSGAPADEALRGDFDLVAVDAQGRPTAVTARLSADPRP